MNKKEIYEHLANIYLDASSKSSKKKHKLSSHPKTVQSVILVSALLVLGLGSLNAYSHSRNRVLPGEIALFLYQNTVKINFNFDPATKEIFSLNLKRLNLSQYKTLAFSIRKTNPKDIISLKVEFTNRFNEKSEIYIKDVSNIWTEHKIGLSRFSRMEYWAQMNELAFIIEEWNVKEKSGIVYLDNIRVIK